MTDDPTTTTDLCTNCGTPLAGPFCHGCGQEAADPVGSLRAFLTELFRETLDLRGRIWSTALRLFTRPGALTRAYIDGQRVRYIEPLQIYLTAATAFFLVSTFKPMVTFDPVTRFTSSTLGVVRMGGQLALEAQKDLTARGVSPALYAERFGNTVNANLPTVLFGSVVLFTLALAVAYNRRRMRILAHAVFALHWIAFYMLVMTVDRFVPSRDNGFSVWKGLIFGYTTVYMAVALRRVYAESWLLTVLKTLVLIFVFNIALAIWIVSVVDVAFRTIK